MTAPAPARTAPRAIDAAGTSDVAMCQRPAFAAVDGRVSLWEGNTHGETWRDKRVRQAAGRSLCGACPVLAECRDYLDTMDRRRLLVDGVVAGEFRSWRRPFRTLNA